MRTLGGGGSAKIIVCPQFYCGDTTYEDLFVTPNKKVINLTIQNHLVNTWCTEWNGLKGHKQTKYWFTMPDPYLA